MTVLERHILKLSRDGTHGYCPSCGEKFYSRDFRRDWTPTKQAQKRGLRGTTGTTWHICSAKQEEQQQ